MSTENMTAVDFSNPEAIASELADLEAKDEAKKVRGTGKTKAAKPAEKKPRVITVDFTADRDIAAGEKISFQYTLPVNTSTRGAVAGIPLDQMNDDQLRIEHRNANSVHYKTVKAGHDATKAAARLNAVKAEMTKRGIQPSSRSAAEVNAETVAELIKSGKISVDELQALLNQTSDTEETNE